MFRWLGKRTYGPQVLERGKIKCRNERGSVAGAARSFGQFGGRPDPTAESGRMMPVDHPMLKTDSNRRWSRSALEKKLV